MKGLHGIIFSYEKHDDLRELTLNRTPASVPFAGRYRIVDFILSSMVNAGITDVGVLLEGNYQSLLDHLGSGKDPGQQRHPGQDGGPGWRTLLLRGHPADPCGPGGQ